MLIATAVVGAGPPSLEEVAELPWPEVVEFVPIFAINTPAALAD